MNQKDILNGLLLIKMLINANIEIFDFDEERIELQFPNDEKRWMTDQKAAKALNLYYI